ncbi:MAG: methyltransferase domain-containing protein [Methanospirillum sp.]|jgi:tRNA (cmo5U34)-methyltransferase|nr:methyltransferase domain-containing protein [Methanospirillum sp.]
MKSFDIMMSDHEHYLNRITQYDTNLFRILPNAELFFSTCLSFIPHRKISILELGSGTGYFTALMLSHCPDYEITCMDKSPEMLDLAKRKKEITRCTFIEGDITTGLPEGTFDCIVSTLTLHHIADRSRKNLIDEIYKKLNPGGLFICGDVMRPEEDWIESIYRSRWEDHMRKTGMPEDQIRETVSGREKAWPLLDTIHGFYGKLKAAGFARILAPLQYDMFGVFIGWK